MATSKTNQSCNYGDDCPPGQWCKNGTCVQQAKKPGVLGNPSAKIGAGLIGAGLTAAGIKIAKGIKENKPIRQARKAAKKNEDLIAMKKGGWIKDAIKKPGALREQLGIKKGKTIPKATLAAAAKKGGKLGQRARLAITLGKMKKK